MATTVLPSEDIFQETLRQGQVRHALKVALACCIATATTHFFHLNSGQLAPVFAFLLFTMGMPSPRMNWLLTQIAVTIGALGSAIILIYFHEAFFLYLALTLLWIFTCLLFSGWLPLPATMAAMISAIGVFTFLEGGLGAAFDFFLEYEANFLVGGMSVVVVHTFIWPLNTPKVFARRLTQAYAYLEEECREGSDWLRTGQAPPPPAPFEEWAPFRPLRQLLAPELFRGRNTTNPFAGLIIACRALNLRLWFFNRAFGHVSPDSLSAETRKQLADRLDCCAAQLARLVTGALNHQQVTAFDASLLQNLTTVDDFTDANAREADPLVAHNIHASILRLLGEDLQTATKFHNELFANFGRGFNNELVNLWPGPNPAGLFDGQSVHTGVKLVLILGLLMLEEGWLGLPGGTQVAFFATFFASTANLGRQNKTDIIDVVGLLSGFTYGVIAAFITSRLPHFPLLLALVFFGQFLADLAFQRLPMYSVAGLQAGLAIPFSFLATLGPEWGSFSTVRTRLAGLLVAGFTAVVVHAFVWPLLPMRLLRTSIAAALRATAESLAELFDASRTTWKCSPTALRETILRARDLLDDARYLPGPDHADATYHGILTALQEIDACLEYIQLLISLEADSSWRQQFVTLLSDYPAAAHAKLEAVAQQFDDPPRRDGAIDWPSSTTDRWDNYTAHSSSPLPIRDAQRLVVIARCLDQIAAAAERVSTIACEINMKKGGS